MDSETEEMVKSFVLESLDSLDMAEPLIEDIKNPDSIENINTIFRVFHTIKGLSSFFGLNQLNSLTHRAETLLDILRKNPNIITDSIIDLIYSNFDLIRSILIDVSKNFNDMASEKDVENMLLLIDEEINSTLFNEGNINIVPENIEIQLDLSEENNEQFNSNNIQIDSEPSTISQQLDLSSLISEDMIETYLSDTKDYLENIDNNLILLEKDPHNADLIGRIFGMVHSVKGNSGFMGYAEIQDIAMETETILDSIRKNELDVESNIISILLSNIEIMRKRVSVISDNFLNSKSKISPAKPEKNLIDKGNKIEPKKINTEQTQPKSASQDESSQNSISQKLDIRVDTTKIDKLFDLVGELITTGNMISNNPDLTNLQLPNFLKATSQLSKITRELQEITMSVRMMPLSGLFNKMKRLVRDTSLKLGKKVNLVLIGQETEMDKNIIEEISDPLMHLVRNAIDHGIENSDVRILQGKTETGTLTLSARYDGNEILISITDDGGGINPETIREKAIERGLINPENDNLSNNDILKLIFEPGFSTAEAVSDISGRGVGLDVVKKNIEKLQGSVDVTSKMNEGTTFTMHIPLTLAIMDAFLFQVGETVFALPLLNVIESFKTTPQHLTKTMDGVEMIKTHNQLLPFIRLYDIFNIEPRYKNIGQGLTLLIQNKNNQCCFFIDELIGSQQIVIKGFPEYLGSVLGLTGCMILNDGNIGLIIDIDNTLKLFENPLSFTVDNFKFNNINYGK